MPKQIRRAYYKKRDIDDRIWKAFEAWYASNKTTWLRLETGLGRGNSAILAAFVKKLKQDYRQQLEVFVAVPWDAISQSELLPPGPIVQTLYRMNVEPGSGFGRIISKIRNSTWGSRTMLAVTLCTILVILILAIRGQGLLGDFSKVGVLGLALGVMLLILTNSLYDAIKAVWSKMAAGPTPHIPDWRKLERFGNEDFLCQELSRLWRDTRRIIIVIDDADHLSASERVLLLNLTHAKSHSESLRKLIEEHQFLIVTVELSRLEHDPSGGGIRYDQIEQFTDSQIDEIGRVCRVPESAIKESIKAHNIKLLFEESYASVQQRVRSALETVRRKAEHDRWSLIDFLCCISVSIRPVMSESEMSRLFSLNSDAFFAIYLQNKNLAAPESGFLTEFLRYSVSIGLLRRDGRSYYRDAAFSKLFAEIASSSDPARVVESHLFWFRNLSAAEAGVESPPSVSRFQDPAEVVLERAHHLVEGASWVMETDPISPQIQLATLAVAMELASEAGDCDSALKYRDASICVLGRHGGHPFTRVLLDGFSAAFWCVYWLFGRNVTIKAIEQLQTVCANLSQSTTWQLNRARYYYHLLGEGSSAQDNIGAAEPPDQWKDFARRTELLLKAREQEGLLFDAIRTRRFNVALPVWDGRVLGESHRLASLAAVSATRRNNEEAFVDIMSRWREELSTSKGGNPKSSTSLEVSNHLGRGLYYSALLGYRRTRKAQGHDDLATSTTILKLRLSTGAREPEQFLLEATGHFEHALQLSLLLGMHPFAMEANTELGFLFAWHRTNEANRRSPSWWREWDAFLKAAMQQESVLQWTSSTPEILRFEYDYFQRFDRVVASIHALALYKALQSGRFERSILLRWNKVIRSLLTGQTATSHTHLACAELWTSYFELVQSQYHSGLTRELCLELIEAANFASQEFRCAEAIGKAATFLDASARLSRELWGADFPTPTLHIPTNERRVFLLGAWERYSMASLDKQEISLLRGLWGWLETDDPISLMCLGSLVENHELAFSQELDLTSDLINPRLSVGQASSSRSMIRNPYEFRVAQALKILCGDSYLEPLDIEEQISRNWKKFSYVHPDTAIVALVRSVNDAALSERIREVLIHLLRGANACLLSQGRNEKKRMLVVDWLRYLDRENLSRWNLEYQRICTAVEGIAELEIAAARIYAHVTESEIAREILEHLDHVNPNVINDQLNSELRRRNQSGADYAQREIERDSTLQSALNQFHEGKFQSAYKMLERFQPSEDQEHVDIKDLKCLELQIKCSSREPELAKFVPSVEARLHTLACRYVKMIADATDDVAEQHLALSLLRILRDDSGENLDRAQRVYRAR